MQTRSPGSLRAAARALERLADGNLKVDDKQLRSALDRAGYEPKETREPVVNHPIGDPARQRPPDASILKSRPDRTPSSIRGPPPPIWVRPKEAARLCGCGLTVFYRWLSTPGSRGIIAKKIGNVRLIYVPSLHALGDDGMSDATD